MGIFKQASKITIKVKENYLIRAGNISEISEQVNIESMKENLTLTSNKKVQMTGDDGVKYDKYSPPELKIEESEYKLESRFALEQLFSFAKKDSKAMFCFWMAEIFGADIPLKAYEKLYQNASDKKEDINPKITVALDLPGFGAAYYSGNEQPKYKNHIIISQGFIEGALENKGYHKLLMIALVEEFGHHLDYLLRNEYSSTKGDAKNDEGAVYTSKMNTKYKKYAIDPFKNKDQHYATAIIKGQEKKLIWDFTDLHEKLNEYVDSRAQEDDTSKYAGFEFFGAGLGDDLHGLGHQSIEDRALSGLKLFAGKENINRSQVYFGNWLRDFSQFIDPMIIRPMANALDMLSEEYKAQYTNAKEDKSVIKDLKNILDENRVTYTDERTYNYPVDYTFSLKNWEAHLVWKSTTLSPVKLSREGVTSLVELMGVKEFGKLKVEADNAQGRPQNYMKYLTDFRNSFAAVTTDLLGVYKPQEHIDNPLALHPKFICEANKKKGKECPPPNFNHQLDPDFVKDPIDAQWNVNTATGTKNYIRGNSTEPFESAYDCFINFLNKSNPNTVQGRINFGAALHILEDFYAHSNFCELAVIKVYDPEVFPWDNITHTVPQEELKKYKADSSSNSFIKNSVIDRSKIKFNTITNPDLHSNAVKQYLKTNPGKKASDYYTTLGSNTTSNKGLYYAQAECAMVQTGSFGMLDTIASIAPKMNNKAFSIDIEEQEGLKEGERTFKDAWIYEMLKDVTNAQSNDTKEKNTAYKGTNDNSYSEAFLKYLDFRDFMVKERVLGYSFKDVTNAFGIFDFIKQYISVIRNVRNHFLTLFLINLIDDLQTQLEQDITALENGTWKVNPYGPTHTQLAKDNGIQPLHHLAVTLAAKAVNAVGALFEKGRIQEIKDLVRTTLFLHPIYTDYMDEEVINWCQQNKSRVKLAHQASIVLYGLLHSYQEISELSREIQLIRDFELTKDENKVLESAIANMKTRWQNGFNRLNELRKKQGLSEITPGDGKKAYDEKKKESGYGK
ncbi:HET-C-related protein [Flavobacterium oreochromis]|uniref:HET-C-related protein n=1 Tax=Flavobacterium oreochromis TaxID=2906078 RepID=UPI00385BE59E